MEAAAVGGSSEGRAAARRLASSAAEAHGEFIMPALADFSSLQLVRRVGWRGERGAAGGLQGAPHEDEGLIRVGEVQRVLALHHVQHARVSKVRSDDLTKYSTCSS